MKLLFDNNLSFKLPRRLQDLCPDSLHVRDVQLATASDAIVWQYAKTNGYIIVSKDSDFHQRSFLEGHPPKVIWIRLGNCTTEQIEALIRNNWVHVTVFSCDEILSFLALG